MKGLMILANGFEDVEALATHDVLKRSMVEVDLVTINETKEVISQYNLHLTLTKTLKEVNLQEYDFLVIPGGGAVSKVLRGRLDIKETIDYFVSQEKLVTTICAAPSLLADEGYFSKEKFTCFPGCEVNSQGGKYISDSGVIKSNHYITAKSMAYSLEFGLEIIKYLQGEGQMLKIKKAIYGEK